MPKIRECCAAGTFHRAEYEIHYSAKERCFLAKKLPSYLAMLEESGVRFQANSEQELEALVKRNLKLVEESATNWQKMIVYRLKTFSADRSHIGLSYGNGIAKSIGFDYQVVYFQTVANTEFYVAADKWDQAVKGGYEQSPQAVQYSDYKGLPRIAYTIELDAFFRSIMNALEKLITQLDERLGSRESILAMASAGINGLALPA